MARVPQPGHCKTRLCPPLEPTEAALLYADFLKDIGALLSTWTSPCDLWVAWLDSGESPGAEAPALLQDLFPDSCRFLSQEGEDLGERMAGVFDRLLQAGYREVVMRNSDSPHLPLALVDQAFEALGAGPPGRVVLGPDLDGGYYLVGLDGAPFGLFPDTMGTASVLEETSAAAREQGREVQLLEPFLDVDSPDDLALFWLEFGGRADVRDWATWRRLTETDILDRLE
ncbi:MAG: TIGR04282 family arsenosugar biosynthesis glycosyltransferase [Myxococcota bacterium]|nr:TIGR04282 family arsenosugar biosynthesis glycosyltransferase [Myxococcota bacterium]